MCLFFHSWSDTYKGPLDLSVYQDVIDDPTFSEEVKRLAKIILKINIKEVSLRKCLDCGHIQSLTAGSWAEYRPGIGKSSIRDFKIKKILDMQ